MGLIGFNDSDERSRRKLWERLPGSIDKNVEGLVRKVPGGDTVADVVIGSDEDPGYGRYYDPISTNDADFAEDSAENAPIGQGGIIGRTKQRGIDRWVQPENEAQFNPVRRMAYRNSDRAEDLAERRYAMSHNKADRAENLGMGRRANRLNERQDRVGARALERSEWQANMGKGVLANLFD